MPIVGRGGYGGGKGWLLIDNRPSGGKLEEFATMTCAHCGILKILNGLRTRPREHCDRCAKYICDSCKALGECNYYEESIELALMYPNQGPFLLRGLNGEPLYDTKLRDKHRIQGVGFSAETKTNPINKENTSEE
jgi:hypothetical protein